MSLSFRLLSSRRIIGKSKNYRCGSGKALGRSPANGRSTVSSALISSCSDNDVIGLICWSMRVLRESVVNV